MFAWFDVNQTDEDVDVLDISTGEWIDLNNGLLVADPNASNLHYNTDGIEDILGVMGIVNDWLRTNPISEATLESYRTAKEEREEELQARYSI